MNEIVASTSSSAIDKNCLVLAFAQIKRIARIYDISVFRQRSEKMLFDRRVASISSFQPSSFGIRSTTAKPSLSCAPVVSESVTISLLISLYSAGSISPSMATMFGRPSRSRTPSAPSETRDPSYSTPLSVGFWEDSAMTPMSRATVQRWAGPSREPASTC